MASPSSSIPSPPPRSPFFTPIPENEDEEKEEDEEQEDKLPNDSQEAQAAAAAAAAAATGAYKHTPTPLHPAASTSDASTTPAASKKKHKHHQAHVVDDDVSVSVSCNKCRPSARDKISIVPLDSSVGGQKQAPPAASSSSSASSPNVLRSLFFSITRRSPAAANASAAGAATAAREVEEWRRAAAELSRKLIHATRRRDEALLESSRLKYSLAELERKVDRLESHCRELKSALDRSTPPAVVPAVAPVRAEPGSSGSPFPLEKFLSAVDDARSGVRHLARSLTVQLRMASLGPRAPGTDRVAALIHPYDPRAAAQWRKNPGGGLLFYMEALLNRVFYSGFETNADDEEPGLIDPTVRCQVNRSSYQSVQGLGWDEVLSKGTKHYSEGLSRFCDRKMSEVVGLVGLNRAWPEGLLQAFFVAAKGAWVVRLMARSVHPALPILRVDQGVKFDSRFMEDVAADRVRRLNPAAVRIMVAPGFHAYTCEGGRGVVKCKALCVYSGNSVGGGNEIGGYNFGVVKENGRKSFEGLHQR